ncbi:MAG: hypothetical protein AMXMBFR60_27310 [Chloroflexota bacterium]
MGTGWILFARGGFVKEKVCMQNMSGNLFPAPSPARDFPRKPPPPTGGFAQDGGLSEGADNLCLHTGKGKSVGSIQIL